MVAPADGTRHVDRLGHPHPLGQALLVQSRTTIRLDRSGLTTTQSLRRDSSCYGFGAEAAAIAHDVSVAARHFLLNQLPELYTAPYQITSNFPVQYLGANVPQAWAAGSVFMLMQALLGFMPDAPRNTLYVDPLLPPWLPDLTVRDLRVGKHKLDMRFSREGGETHFRGDQGRRQRGETMQYLDRGRAVPPRRPRNQAWVTLAPFSSSWAYRAAARRPSPQRLRNTSAGHSRTAMSFIRRPTLPRCAPATPSMIVIAGPGSRASQPGSTNGAPLEAAA